VPKQTASVVSSPDYITQFSMESAPFNLLFTLCKLNPAGSIKPQPMYCYVNRVLDKITIPTHLYLLVIYIMLYVCQC